MFIGAEGTLGVVSSVSVATVQKPKSVSVALIGKMIYRHLFNPWHTSDDNLILDHTNNYMYIENMFSKFQNFKKFLKICFFGTGEDLNQTIF